MHKGSQETGGRGDFRAHPVATREATSNVHLQSCGESSSSTSGKGKSRPAVIAASQSAGIEAWEQPETPRQHNSSDGRWNGGGTGGPLRGGLNSTRGSNELDDGVPAQSAGDVERTPDELRKHTRLICDLGRRHLWREAIEAFAEVEQPDMIIRSALLGVLAKAALWESTMQQLREIREAGMDPNVVTYNAAISAARVRGWADAIRLLGEMLERRVMPNGITYTTLVQACEHKGEWEHAWDLMGDMARAGLTPTVDLYRKVIGMPNQDGRWEWSLALLEDMVEKGLRPDEKTLRAACAVCEQDYRWRESLELLERVKMDNARSRRFCPPDAFYASVMRACEKCRHWEHVLSLFDAVISRSRRITNVQICDAALGACELGCRWKEALRVLGSMKRSALKPDLHHYNAALCTLETCTKWAHTLALLDEVDSMGFRPSVESYNSAMIACEGGDKWALALALLDQMRSSGLEPDAITYNASMHACSKGGKWEFAVALLEQASRQGLTVNDHTLDTAITVCLESDQWEAVWRLAQRAQSLATMRGRSSRG